MPRWRWQVGNVVLEREIAMAHGRCAVGVVHRLVYADRPVGLELTPLCTWRSVHGERFANGDPAVEGTTDGFAFEGAYRVEGAGWRAGGEWYRGVRAREEAARGLNDREDLWAAGAFAVELRTGDTHEVTAAAGPGGGSPPSAAAIVAGARERAAGLVRRAGVSGEVDEQLVLAADQFVIDHDGPTAVAGYPWFGEWSRDLMTSYEGLFLSTGRAEEGREALRRAAATLSEGMLANTADTGMLEYNTVDGTLWFVHALGRHVEVTGDDDLGAELSTALGEIVERHLAGTRFGIGADADGLLRGGEDGWALTWMDARIDGVPVTPRIGKPVEVNALWIRALDLAGRLGRADRWLRTLETARASFVERFVRSDGRGLLDLVDGPGGDDAGVASEPVTRGLAAGRAARRSGRQGRGPRRRGRMRTAPDTTRPTVARAGRSRLPTAPPREPCGAGLGLPPGHRLAVADRPLRRRRPPRRRADRRPARRSFGPRRRVGARLGLGDGGRSGAARRDRLPVPGLVGGRAASRPPRRLTGRRPARRRETAVARQRPLLERTRHGCRDH